MDLAEYSVKLSMYNTGWCGPLTDEPNKIVLLSQIALVCRLSDPLCRDSRDCRDQGGSQLPKTFYKIKIGNFSRELQIFLYNFKVIFSFMYHLPFLFCPITRFHTSWTGDKCQDNLGREPALEVSMQTDINLNHFKRPEVYRNCLISDYFGRDSAHEWASRFVKLSTQ